MERWRGRVALVTGASAGIGAAIAKELVLKGMKVVGAARRVERVEALREELKDAPGQLYPRQCDVSNEADVLAAFEWVKNNLGGVDVLVNNAGIVRDASLHDGATADWRNILETNVLGLCVATREALKSMREIDVDDGHIIHINSIAGHRVASTDGMSMYSASKHAVKVLTEGLRQELVDRKSRTRVTSISPGAVRTDILAAANMSEREKYFLTQPLLEPQDIADAVLYVLGAPPHVQIHELTIKPTGEIF